MRLEHEGEIRTPKGESAPPRRGSNPAMTDLDMLERRSLWVEVPGEEAGLALIERLGPLHAELAPSAGGCCRVAVELREQTVDAVRRVLAVVLAWARACGIEAARLELDGRVIGVAGPAPANTLSRMATTRSETIVYTLADCGRCERARGLIEELAADLNEREAAA